VGWVGRYLIVRERDLASDELLDTGLLSWRYRTGDEISRPYARELTLVSHSMIPISRARDIDINIDRLHSVRGGSIGLEGRVLGAANLGGSDVFLELLVESVESLGEAELVDLGPQRQLLLIERHMVGLSMA